MAAVSDNMSKSVALVNLDESFIMSGYLLSNKDLRREAKRQAGSRTSSTQVDYRSVSFA